MIPFENRTLAGPVCGDALPAPTKDFNPGNVPEKYLDLLFYQDPNCGSLCTDTSLKNIIQINNTDAGPGAELMLSGALYFPTQILAVESQSSLIVDGLVVAPTKYMSKAIAI